MITTGLVSITFRQLLPAQIIALVQQAGLTGIEWGGDIHVPHGDFVRAREVRQRTLDAGLTVAAYGSYYKLNKSEADGLRFESVLETAVALGAPTIRVWAGALGSAQADAASRAAVVADAQRIAGLAQAAGVTVSSEYHARSLTDTNTSAQTFLTEIQHPNFFTFWQPHNGAPVETNLTGLRAILPRLTQVHCFHWLPPEHERRPLAEGADVWRQYFAVVKASGRDHCALLEFVAGDEPANFLRDAVTLRQLVA